MLQRLERFFIIGAAPITHTPHAIADFADLPISATKTSIVHRISFGVRRQSAAATALWMNVIKCEAPNIQSAVAAALCRRTPHYAITVLELRQRSTATAITISAPIMIS